MTDISSLIIENSNSDLQASFMPNQVFTVRGDDQSSALELLYLKTSINKKILKEAAQKGAIWISRQSQPKTDTPSIPAKDQPDNKQTNNKKTKAERLRRLKRTLKQDQVISFYYNPELLDQIPQEPRLIDDMGSYSVWIKPRGMLSQGSKWADHTALYRWVEMNFSELHTKDKSTRQCWIVHRLDRATCGLMLLAHSKKMASKLSKLFESHAINKSYRAWVWGKLNSKQQTISTPIDNKEAVSHITQLDYHQTTNATLIEIKIETGRKHQIRKHLSGIQHPIIGDRLYGRDDLDARFASRPDLQLTAFRLEFLCPETNQNKTYQLQGTEMALLNNIDMKSAFDK